MFKFDQINHIISVQIFFVRFLDFFHKGIKLTDFLLISLEQFTNLSLASKTRKIWKNLIGYVCLSIFIFVFLKVIFFTFLRFVIFAVIIYLRRYLFRSLDQIIISFFIQSRVAWSFLFKMNEFWMFFIESWRKFLKVLQKHFCPILCLIS